MAFCRLRCLRPADWFERNLRGDVVAVYDYQGTKLLSYKYDAWGNFTTTNHQSTIPAPVSNNPFRYRGYYYDKDLSLYYLNARYYDQGTRRFVSGDEAGIVTATPEGLTDIITDSLRSLDNEYFFR